MKIFSVKFLGYIKNFVNHENYHVEGTWVNRYHHDTFHDLVSYRYQSTSHIWAMVITLWLDNQLLSFTEGLIQLQTYK